MRRAWRHNKRLTRPGNSTRGCGTRRSHSPHSQVYRVPRALAYGCRSIEDKHTTMTPCNRSGCPTLVRRGKCLKHSRQERQRYEAGRVRDPFYSSSPWRNLRATILEEQPYCCECGTTANTVDHIVPRSERPDLSMEPNNLRSYCARHHNAKTARQDGGFGNPRTRFG